MPWRFRAGPHAAQALSYATVGLRGGVEPLVVRIVLLPLQRRQPNCSAEIDAIFEMAGDEGAIVYVDPGRGIDKRAIARDGRLLGVRLLAKRWRWPG